MQARRLLAAVVVLVAFGGLVWWSNKAKKAEADKPADDKNPKVINVPEAEIQQVDIRRKDGETTTLKRTASGDWEITAPTAYRADKDAVNSLVTALASLASDSLVDEKPADLEPFGLKTPALNVSLLKKDGKTVQLLVGDDVPAGSGQYVKVDGDARVFTIASWTKSSIDKKATDLRDKRLLTFDSEKLTRVELAAKKSTTEFGKNNANEWSILKPKPYRADGWQVEELIRQLKDAKLDPAVTAEDAKKAAAAFAGAAAVATAQVTDSVGTQKLEVRKSKDNQYYAKSSAVEGIHKLTSEVGEGLDKSTDDFRNKKVFDFGFSDPSKVEYKSTPKTMMLFKNGEKWSSGGKEMDAVSVQSLIDRLRDLTATKFSEAAAPAGTIEIIVTSNDGKRVEKVSLGKQGEEYLARREGEVALYAIDKTAIEALEKTAADVKEPAPAKKDDGKKK